MENAKNAAKYLRMVWQGHDEKNEELCVKGQYDLYSILTNASDSDKLFAAKLVKEAFWLSDEAEKYQTTDKVSDKEYEIYGKAGQCLEQSRTMVGLEIDSVRYTITWWIAYRHKDKYALFKNLMEEHLVQFKDGDVNAAESCAERILIAAAEHKKKNWDAVDKKLEEYFEVYLQNRL